MAKDLMINDEIFMIYFQNRGLNVVSPATATEPIAGIGDVCKCIFVDVNIEGFLDKPFHHGG